MQQVPRRKRHLARRGIVRRTAMATAFTAMAALLIPLATQVAAQAADPGTCGTGDPASAPGLCSVTIDARDFGSQAPLANFNYVINVDNTKLPSDPLALDTESNSPIVREGDQDRSTVTLPGGRYLVSVRSLDHKMWGAYFTLPDDAATTGCGQGVPGCLTVRVDLTEQSEAHPLPLGKIRVFVFEDNGWTNGAPDTEEGGLGNFQVGLEEQTGSAVTVDYNNVPLCGGICKTSNAAATLGFAQIDNLGPATYSIDVHAPEGPCNSDPNSAWYQTTTIDGGLNLLAPTEEGADGTGAPGEQLWEPPNIRTAYWFGFVCAPQPFANSGTGEIVGQARNWVEWAPYTIGTFNDPVENPFVALSDASTDRTVYVGQGDAAGNFDIQNVPAGDYNLAVWDEQLSYIMRFKPVHVNAGATVDVNETGDDGSVGLGVSRWFGWLDGTVYKDLNDNGQYDEGIDAPISNTDVDQRWRDGSIKEGTITDPNGYYQYPTAEGGALGRWIIGEQGFARFSAPPGASTHDERTGAVTPSCLLENGTPADPCVPNSLGGGLLMNQLLLEGHRVTVDWGKRDYPAGTPGQIVGITYFATTRNEFNARNQAHEDYEPAIPDVTVYLETLGPDGLSNTDDDVIVNKYVTDHWQQPSTEAAPDTQTCAPIKDQAGNDISDQFNPKIGPNCLEVPLTGAQTKEGAFDGGYAFADYCPNGYDLAADDGTCNGGTDPVGLVAGDYIVHAIMPKDASDTRPCNPANPDGFKNISDEHGSVPGGGEGCLYRIVREEDVNVDLGNHFAPAIPPPPCVGDDHVLDQSSLVDRSPYFGDPSAHAPLCDKHLVVLENGLNANADFNMMTNFRTDPNGADTADTRTGDVAEPGRIVGQVFNDIYFERDPASPWYGEPRPIGGIPVGIYARVDTVPNVSCPSPNQPGIRCFDGNIWRQITTLTTSPDGTYEALLPSTETFNCPIPQGPCPGMYLVTVDDPGSKAHPNANYNPNLLTATTPAEVWPGLTDQLDTPVDPISGTACEDPAGGTTPDPSDPARPDLLQIDVPGPNHAVPDAPSSSPVVAGGATGIDRRVAILSDFIGTTGTATNANGVRVLLTDDRTGQVTTLTRGNGGIVSWVQGSGANADRIVIQVPLVSPSFTPGPKQLNIVTANVNGGVSSVNGITLHVLYGSNTVTSTRTDTGATINNGTRVYDPSLTLGDGLSGLTGWTLTGSGIPAGTTITGVNYSLTAANRFFTMNNAATATANGVSLTISQVRTGNTTSATTNRDRVYNTGLSLADVARLPGKRVSGPGIPAGTTVTGVNFSLTPANRYFTISSLATATASGVSLTFSRIDPSNTNNGTLVLDAAITNADVGAGVSALAPGGIPPGTTISSVTAGVSFVMSAAATQTGTRDLNITTTSSVTPYNPAVVNVGAPTFNGTELQDAIDGANAGDLLVLSPGVYNENVLMWKPVKIQGLGPGGIIGAHELQGRDPEDPRFNIQGSIIDGRFFQQNFTGFDATVADNGPYALANAPLNVVLRGADITVVAKTTSAYDVQQLPAGQDSAGFNGARIDGLGLMTGHGDGAGGVEVQANANNLQLTNNVLENNGGVFAGGIGIGQPFARNSHNFNVRVANDRVIGNGGLTTSGGVGIFYGSNSYEVTRSVICSNFSVEYGAGISHIGLSPNGSIHDNRIYYNEAVDSGGGIAIEGELVVGGGSLSDGSGAVNVDRNLIQSNMSTLDDGGGVFVLDALDQPINIRNNMIVNNVAADLGGSIMLDDASNVRIINNTISNNATTGSSENSDGLPHGAGLTSEANDPLWGGDATHPVDPRYAAQYPNAATRPDFSNPVALFNNIFWNNDAMTLSQSGPGATLVDAGFIDLEIHGTTNNADTFTPRFSDLTNGQILGPNGVLHAVPGGQGNISADPLFVAPFINELAVSGSRLDPQQAAVSITGQDPPVGLTGDYHLTAGSPVIDRGAGFSNLVFTGGPFLVGAIQTPNAASILAPCSGTLAQAYPADFDRQFRPQTRTGRVRTPWDMGADELPGTLVSIPKTTGSPQFNWNNAGHPFCINSTETR